MRVYHNDEVIVEGAVNVRQLRQFYMKEQLNEHMVFCLSGDISREDAAEYEKSRLLGQMISVYGSGGKEDIIGCGVITEAEIFFKGTCCILLRGTSFSRSMDDKRRMRSFQNPYCTYREIIKKMSGKNMEIFFRYHKDEHLNTPIIQYKETDWEVLRRLASQLNTVLIPDTLSGKPRVFFGLSNGTVYHLNDDINKKLCIEKCRGIHRKSYCVTGLKTNMRLGDSVILENKSWSVVQKEVALKNGKKEMQYVLGLIQDWGIPFTYNCNLRGSTIRGSVLKRKNEHLKLRLEIDSEQRDEDAYWYPYLPETGNVLYAMPETGTEVVLYFPDMKEKNGIVIHSFYQQGYQGGEKNHDVKEMITPKGKGIRFWPGMIAFFGGKEQITNKIYLGEDTGFQFLTKKAVHIMADCGISIQSGLSCSATAANHISITQSEGKNSIEMSGNQILFQAEKYYTASATHQSKSQVTERNDELEFKPFSQLYSSFTGMLAQGDSGGINQRILGGIPVLGSLKSEVTIQNQVGLKTNGKF